MDVRKIANGCTMFPCMSLLTRAPLGKENTILLQVLYQNNQLTIILNSNNKNK